MEKAKNKKQTGIYIIIMLIIILFGVGFYGIYKGLTVEVIYEGINIDNSYVGNMTKDEAKKIISSKKEEELKDKQMKLKYDEFVYEIGLKDLGFSYDYEEAIDKAYSIGREGNVIKRIKTILKTKKNGKNIKLKSGYDKKLIDEYVEKIKQDINLESKDAILKFNGGSFAVTQEVVGRQVDEEKLKKSMKENIYVLNDIDIPVDIIKPKVTKDLLGRVNGIIGQFSTTFRNNNVARVENMKIASNAISGKLIMPGETASFNELTGPRSKAKGYKEANIILNGEFVPGLGGGVCQVSTTLYNALLLANLKIVERYPHSIPSKYVKFGQDAAVSYGHLDLKFRNDFDFPVYLDMVVTGDKINAYVYGDRNSKNYEVKIVSEIIEKVEPKVEKIKDNGLKLGSKVLIQQGRVGYKVKTNKIITKNGKVIKKEQISWDYYKPRNYIYKVGS